MSVPPPPGRAKPGGIAGEGRPGAGEAIVVKRCRRWWKDGVVTHKSAPWRHETWRQLGLFYSDAGLFYSTETRDMEAGSQSVRITLCKLE
jgi:hypothetical protein